MSEDRSYHSNRNRIPFHVRQVSLCSTGLHTKPASFCSICDGICRSMPFVVLDANYLEVCDTCADALNLPAYKIKKLYDQSVQVIEGTYEVNSDTSFHWQVALQQKQNLRLNLHAKALVESLCNCCVRFGLIQAYIVTMRNAPVFQYLTGNYIDRDLLEKVYERAEPEILSLVESGQQEEYHMDYFYLVESRYYPPGLNPVKRDQSIEPPMWDWKDYPEFQ